MNKKTVPLFLAGCVGGGVGLYLILMLVSWWVRPAMLQQPPAYKAEELKKVETLRRVSIDPDNLPVIHRDVDYNQGRTAAWYPKNEAPALSALVKENRLPALPERIGKEPIVVEGVEGIGAYGGTWMYLATSEADIEVVQQYRMSYANLVRWSPQGYPLVPHIAKSFIVSPDSREFTFTLRKGMKWSDGHPFTADDILYWWEHECNDTLVMAKLPAIMVLHNKAGRVEKVDQYTVKFSFLEPNGMFLFRLAAQDGSFMCDAPEHYLGCYHPRLGNSELIERRMQYRKLPNARAVYRDIKTIYNPEHPRSGPWIYRTYKSTPPHVFVRNPYYCMVDTKGNQLPYVDRILYEVKSPDMIGISFAQGEATMQSRHTRYDQYTLLMSQRMKYEYDVYHWYMGERSAYSIYPNLNMRVDQDDPATGYKHTLLNDKRFRQALSLAIDRWNIIDAEYNGQTMPAQAAPGPESYFYSPQLCSSFIAYDPERAGRLLDEIGLSQRDKEGFRSFPDGSHMVFFLNYFNGFINVNVGRFVVDDWARVGIRTILRERTRNLWQIEKLTLKNDFTVYTSMGEYNPLLQPLSLVPINENAIFAAGFGKWYDKGGLFGNPLADRAHGCIAPPLDHPLRKALEAYEQVIGEQDPGQQRETFSTVLTIAAENVWSINICTSPPVLAVVKNGFRNVPRLVVDAWPYLTPGNAGPETFYFERPESAPGVFAQMKKEILEPALPHGSPALEAGHQPSATTIGSLVKYAFLAILVASVLLISLKHPFIVRRLLIMIPTLFIISVITFAIIQFPPGDFLTTKIAQLQESGDGAALQQIEDLKNLFKLDEPMPKRFFRWLGVFWFTSFQEQDKGLLQGYLGMSMENMRPVNDLVGDRILLTVLVSLGTILFTWALAIPIGIYSAVRQYSFMDYVLTFLGFIGMCIPGFLLALLLMYLSADVFGITISGLFSSEYAVQPDWTWGKVKDLLKHVWVPVVVLGVGGTGWMIRVMRANLLDELRKPYVVTARAKGVRPLKLLFKYPVRLAINPFVSGIGVLFPQIVSGGAIVSIVLSLPMVGPVMLNALMTEDMYLAGSMLMVLSMLGILGTLVSDLLLLWLDPRIRLEGGHR